jgi:hypothetical protein
MQREVPGNIGHMGIFRRVYFSSTITFLSEKENPASFRDQQDSRNGIAMGFIESAIKYSIKLLLAVAHTKLSITLVCSSLKKSMLQQSASIQFNGELYRGKVLVPSFRVSQVRKFSFIRRYSFLKLYLDSSSQAFFHHPNYN